ncbi:putative cellulase, partial [Piromyces finnis]
MKFSTIITAIAALVAPMTAVAKSQDYARHLELSLLFYEAQRSGKLPENNRIYWRHDSLVDAGADNGVDLSGGYYDAGDNAKFNFPGAATMTLLAWSGIDYAEGYKSAGQWEYILDAVRWGADYFMKCHTGKNELYAQVGDGNTDHGFWYPPEYVKYDYPSFKVTAEKPGSEVAGETAAFLAAASILFKDEDSSYSAKLLKHAKEIYEFADTYRGDYTGAIPGVVSFYSTYSGYNDELAWGAAWLLRATGDESYLNKYNVIANKKYESYDPKKFSGATGPISWDDKRPGCYILIAMVTGDENRIKEAYNYCDAVLTQPKTPGGLWYDDGLSMWGSNRYASNAASMLAMFANYLPKSDPKRAKYVEFVQQQTNYILGDNPAKINYVVGAEANSPKAVHHRGSSGVFDSQDKAAKPDENIYTLWGALAGGPDETDSYIDTRSNFRTNEVALDYNAAFQMNLAFLTQEGLSKPDPDSVKIHERSWPKKAETPDIRLKFSDGELSIATGSGMRCSGWCVSFTSSSYKITQTSDGNIVNSGPEYTICNKRENNALDGKGTAHIVTFQASGSSLPTEFTVLCDGFHAPLNHQKYSYIPEWGRQYKVVNGGGVENTTPLFEETECWPGFICDGSAPSPSTTKTKTPVQTSVSNDCFAIAQGYECCNDNEVVYTDESGQWGIKDGQWCGIGGASTPEPTPEPQPDCGAYPCCNECEVIYTDNDGDWGVENNEWCLINKLVCGGNPKPKTCTGQDSGFPCCNHCEVIYNDNDGPWGIENGEWCGISSEC